MTPETSQIILQLMAADPTSVFVACLPFGDRSIGSSTPVVWLDIIQLEKSLTADAVEDLLGFHHVVGPYRLGKEEETLLMLAAKRGAMRCVKALLPLSQPDDRNAYGYTALMGAISGQQQAIVELLLPASDLSLSHPFGTFTAALATGRLAYLPLLWRAMSPCARQEQGAAVFVDEIIKARAHHWPLLFSLTHMADPDQIDMLSAFFSQLSAALDLSQQTSSPSRFSAICATADRFLVALPPAAWIAHCPSFAAPWTHLPNSFAMAERLHLQTYITAMPTTEEPLHHSGALISDLGNERWREEGPDPAGNRSATLGASARRL